MSDTISLDFIGATLRTIQAEQRTARMEMSLLREQIGRMATKQELLEVLDVLARRIGNFEALIETRLDHIGSRLDHVESRFDHMDARFDQLASLIAGIGR